MTPNPVAQQFLQPGVRRNADAITTWLLVAAVFLSSYHQFRLAGINFTVSDLLFTALLCWLLITHKLQVLPFSEMTACWVLAFAFMLSGLFVGSLVNGDLSRWGIIAGQYLFAFVLVPILIVKQPDKLLDRAVVAFIAGVTVMEVLGIAGYYYFGSPAKASAALTPEFITGAKRLGAFLGEANWNGAMIAMALQFVIYAARKQLVKSWLGLCLSLVLLWALTLTASFTAFTAAILGGLINVFIGRAVPSAKFIAGAVLVATILWATGYRPPDVFTNRVGAAYEQGSLAQAGTFTGRKQIAVEAWDIVEDTTLVGLGADQYRRISASEQPVHNIYLLMWAEGGFFALFGWIGLISMLMMMPLAAWRVDRIAAALGVGVVMVFIVTSMATPHMFARLWTVPIFIACGIALAAKRVHVLPMPAEWPQRLNERARLA